eukprot:TRINITY_DN1842_c0_g1_i2.p1 TRINITY_DN1842_c0_g1~~TRINITY_DN1842_c0_g1_i2.p1  ORF type:complete len:444 (+),score=111.44 TRINITY_DN1842_c0_g1_i2:275-1606(+)
MDGPSLAPQWLSFGRDPGPPARGGDRRPVHPRRENSSHNLAFASSTLEGNPRVLNRSRSSPMFDGGKSDRAKSPRSPKHASPSGTPPKTTPRSEPASILHAHIHSQIVAQEKPPSLDDEDNFPSLDNTKTTRPPLLYSRSQPNLLDEYKPGSGKKPTSAPMSPRQGGGSSSSSSSPVSSPPATMAQIVAPVVVVAAPPAAQPLSEQVQIEKLKSLVPTLPPGLPKASRHRLDFSSLKKSGGSSSSGQPVPMKKPASPIGRQAFFRKFPSEPAMLLPVDAHTSGQKAALHVTPGPAGIGAGAGPGPAAAREDKPPAPRKGSTGEDKEDRNDFFRGLVRREKSGENLTSGSYVRTSPLANTHVESAVEAPSPAPVDEESVPAPEPVAVPSAEDEERFMRGLGWVPEEEDHVPELDADEIAKGRLKLMTLSDPGTVSKLNKLHATL